MENRDIDHLDGLDERRNPYKYTCKKHGSGYGPTDECPKCMEEDYLLSMSEGGYHCALCGKLVVNDPEGDDTSIIVHSGYVSYEDIETDELEEVYHTECWSKILKLIEKSKENKDGQDIT